MFEQSSQPLLSKHAFAKRLFIAFAITIVIVATSLAFGLLGFHLIGNMTWDEAFHRTCLVLSGHDVDPVASTASQRFFSGIFVLYSRLVFVSLVTILFVPILHRVLHKLHLDTPDSDR